jgi:hypothetical protein
VDVNGVGAMDVSVKRSAAEFCANVIARSDDKTQRRQNAATTKRSDDKTQRRQNAATTKRNDDKTQRRQNAATPNT